MNLGTKVMAASPPRVVNPLDAGGAEETPRRRFGHPGGRDAYRRCARASRRAPSGLDDPVQRQLALAQRRAPTRTR